MEDIHNKFIQSWHTGVPVKELRKQFSICKSTAYNWIKLYSPIKRPEKETITAHKIYQLERKIQILKTENEIFKRCGCGLNSPLDEKIAAIERLKKDFSIYALCKTLNILRSTYYHRVLRTPKKTPTFKTHRISGYFYSKHTLLRVYVVLYEEDSSGMDLL